MCSPIPKTELPKKIDVLAGKSQSSDHVWPLSLKSQASINHHHHCHKEVRFIVFHNHHQNHRHDDDDDDDDDYYKGLMQAMLVRIRLEYTSPLPHGLSYSSSKS